MVEGLNPGFRYKVYVKGGSRSKGHVILDTISRVM